MNLMYKRTASIQTRKPNLMVVNKEKMICQIIHVTVSTDRKFKIKESETEKYQDFAQDLKTIVEHEGQDWDNKSWCNWNKEKNTRDEIR